MARDILKEVRHAKLQNLKRQIKLLQDQSPFYAAKLHGVDPDSLESLDQLACLPYTTNREIKEAGPFGLLLRSARPEAYYESSGTTGQPTSGFPDLSPEKAASFGRFLDEWMGLRNARITRALVSLAYEMNPTGYRFQVALPHAGVTVIPCGVRSTICPPETILSLISKLEPGAIFGRPFEILRMADAFRCRGGDLDDTSVSKIFMLGEPISRNKWRRIGEAWGNADLYAHYGLTEVDTGLHTCAYGCYHEPLSPHAHFALVDEGSRQITDGDMRGELVVSVLKQAHAPLLNYRTGDLAAIIPGRCKCGLETTRYDIVGRAGDGVVIDGRPVFPVEVEDAVYALEDVGNEYIFVITEQGELKLILERALRSTAPLAQLAAHVVDHVKSVLGITVLAEVYDFGSIADKLGIAKKKSARFTDLRGLSPEARSNELRINVIDSRELRTGTGAAISI